MLDHFCWDAGFNGTRGGKQKTHKTDAKAAFLYGALKHSRLRVMFMLFVAEKIDDVGLLRKCTSTVGLKFV